MRFDPAGCGFATTILTALLSTAILAAVHSWWVELSYGTFGFSVFVVSVSAGILAFFIRRRTGG